MNIDYVDSMDDAYCNYLTELIDGDSHSILLSKLSREPFVWFVENDSARCEDGLRLRDDFCDLNYHYDDLECGLLGGCNVLEVLIGLSKRMASLTADIGERENVAGWFWEMLDNIGLEILADYCYAEEGGDDEVEYILSNFIKRDYEPNGQGGLFPLQRTDIDLSEVELWYQMSFYLDEKVFKFE